MAGTTVLTPAGEVAIESLVVGGSVWSVDDEGKLVRAEIKEVLVHPEHEERRFEVLLAPGWSIEATEAHRFFHPECGDYHPLDDFAEGDVLQAWTDGASREVKIAALTSKGTAPVDVFNLHVEPHNNYIAGGVLVHNAKN